MLTTKELFVGIGLSAEKAEQTLKNTALAKALEHCIREVRFVVHVHVVSPQTGIHCDTGTETRGRG